MRCAGLTSCRPLRPTKQARVLGIDTLGAVWAGGSDPSPPEPLDPATRFALRPSNFELPPSPLELRPSPFALRPSPLALRPSPLALRPSNFPLASGRLVRYAASLMKATPRRRFLRDTAVMTSALSLSAPAVLRAAGSEPKVILGLIGPGGMGMSHLRTFAASPDIEWAYVCDPFEPHRARAVAEVEKLTRTPPKAVADLRRVLEDPRVDAVVIATPDHWHVPAALLALEAGKHVYVEKPCSHNVAEGRWLVEAARRAKRVVQVGTQSRSTDHVRQAMQRLRDGAIGEVLVAKAWNSQLRRNIGKVAPSDPPPELDYDLWVGPAPLVPYQANVQPSSWRWFTAFGCGDAGNDGVHELDLARWGLGADVHPHTITGIGGKYFFEDDQQFPDTQYVAFEYDLGGRPRQLVYEQRLWSPYVQEGHENGNAFYGTQGVLILGKQSGWQLFGPRNQLIAEQRGSPSLPAHHRNFLDAIRHGQPPHADAETGHLSAALAHFANLASRIEGPLRFDPAREQFIGNDAANAALRRTYRAGHWAVPNAALSPAGAS